MEKHCTFTRIVHCKLQFSVPADSRVVISHIDKCVNEKLYYFVTSQNNKIKRPPSFSQIIF